MLGCVMLIISATWTGFRETFLLTTDTG